MNAQLIMLPSPILCIGDDFHNNNLAEKDFAFHWRTKEILQVISKDTKTGCWLCNDNTHRDSYKLLKIIAGIEDLPKLDISLIADEIGWFDVEKLADEFFKDWSLRNRQSSYDMFRRIFKFTQSLNEKKYSKEDMSNLWQYIVDGAKQILLEGITNVGSFEDYIKSITQPKVYNVELEMEDKIALDGHTVIGKEPTITNNTITVTKILK